MTAPKTPMVNKVRRCRAKYKLVQDFLRWMKANNFRIAHRDNWEPDAEHTETPVFNIEHLADQFFKIDWPQFQREAELYEQWMKYQRKAVSP